MSRAQRSSCGGFSLLEIALVLVILGILSTAAMVPLASIDSQRRERQVQADLARVRDALIARLVTHDALPCPIPATPVPAGAPVDGRCRAWRGGVPAHGLSLAGATDTAGALLDPWGRRYRLALSDADDAARGAAGAPDWSVPGESSAVGIERLRGSLTLCERPQARCPARALRASDLVFVVLSLGADAGASGYQSRNQAADGSFTLAAPSDVPATRFDDALVWASRSELVWWLLRAGRLP